MKFSVVGRVVKLKTKFFVMRRLFQFLSYFVSYFEPRDVEVQVSFQLGGACLVLPLHLLLKVLLSPNRVFDELDSTDNIVVSLANAAAIVNLSLLSVYWLLV